MKQDLIGKSIDRAKSALIQGELVGIATETVYGLAANALNETAVAKIFEAKQRPTFDPLIVHVANIHQIEKYTTGIPKSLEKLVNRYMPGPLTLILPKKDLIPHLVSSGLDSIGIRIPNHPLTLELLRQLDFPLAAPSANPFGYISPTRAEHVAKQLGNKVAYILDGAECSIGVESTILDATSEPYKVLRKGGLSLEEIAEQIGYWPEVQEHSSSNPKAPGMLASHYAPSKKIYLLEVEELSAKRFEKHEAVLSFGKHAIKAKHHWNLSAQADYLEASQNLFAYMRQLDENEEIKTIYAHLLPEENLGRAINDRLRRATVS